MIPAPCLDTVLAAATENATPAWLSPQVFAALVTALLGLVTAVVTLVLKARAARDAMEREILLTANVEREKARADQLEALATRYDAGLRSRRFKAYPRLWGPLDVLALYAPPADVTYGDLERLATHLRQWYFRHGLLLSDQARDAYFALQDALAVGLRAARPAEEVIRRRDQLLTRAQMDQLDRDLDRGEGRARSDAGTAGRSGSPSPAFIRARFSRRVGPCEGVRGQRLPCATMGVGTVQLGVRIVPARNRSNFAYMPRPEGGTGAIG